MCPKDEKKARREEKNKRKLNQRQRDRGKLDQQRIGLLVFDPIREFGNSPYMGLGVGEVVQGFDQWV